MEATGRGLAWQNSIKLTLGCSTRLCFSIGSFSFLSGPQRLAWVPVLPWRLWSRWPRSSTRAFLHIGCSSLRRKSNSCRSISARRVTRSRRRAATVCAIWVQALGVLDTSSQQSLPETDRYPAKRTTVTSVYGAISYLQSPFARVNHRRPSAIGVVAYLKRASRVSQSFDRDESTMFRVPASNIRYRRTLFTHGYEEPCFVK
jgi:hypothetical protein